MIEIPLVALVMVYLAAVVGLVGWSWWRGSRRTRKAHADDNRGRVVCRACAHVFIDRSATILASCPHCGRPNEREE